MNLTTTYLGQNLKNPIVPSASPLMRDADNVKRLEDAGAAAVVLHSLFEEQVTDEALQLHYHTTQGTESFAESLSYFPEPSAYKFGGDEYVEHLQKVKASVGIPVIGSLNGASAGGWLQYAKQFEEAGVAAIELNIYNVATDPDVQGGTLEDAYVQIIKGVKTEVSIPVAVKLSPFFTSLPSTLKKLTDAGADGFVLFNRFYQPDFDIDERQIAHNINLSSSLDNRLSLRWIAILHGRLNASLAATSGIHTASDVVKLIMAGADVTMMCSALLMNGPGYLNKVLKDLEAWMQEREYESVQQMKGSMSQKAVPSPAAFERALYLKELHSYR